MFLPVGAVAAAAFGIAASVFFMGGLLLLSIGILGEYMGRVYDEVRNRPLSLISHVHRAQIMIPSQMGMIAMPGGYGTLPEAYAISGDHLPDEDYPGGVAKGSQEVQMKTNGATSGAPLVVLTLVDSEACFLAQLMWLPSESGSPSSTCRKDKDAAEGMALRSLSVSHASRGS